MKKMIFLLCVTLIAQIKPVGTSRNVTTAGTPVQLSATRILARSLTIQAKTANTGNICVGGLSTTSCGSSNGIVLAAGAALSYVAVGEAKTSNYYDLSAIYLDSTQNGEGVLVTYVLP